MNTPRVVVPYFGTRYRTLLDQWVQAFERSGCRWPYSIATHEDLALPYPAQKLDVAPFLRLTRPGQAFDLKGAIVCALLKESDCPLLVLDADAFLLLDPAPALRYVDRAPIAMPWDHGAYAYNRAPKLETPYSWCAKRCAGVMWFEEVTQRPQLLVEYARAWQELKGLLPWSPPLPHLLEQYAWSLVCDRMEGAELPHVMNWCPHILGDNPKAVIYHFLGKQKLRD